jgi:hypothetical protein
MMVINQGTWIIGTRPTQSQHPGHHIDVFARKESAGTKSFIETTDRLQGRPAAGEISALNQARGKKLAGTKVLSAGFFLNCDPVILRIMEENSPTYES